MPARWMSFRGLTEAFGPLSWRPTAAEGGNPGALSARACAAVGRNRNQGAAGRRGAERRAGAGGGAQKGRWEPGAPGFPASKGSMSP